MAKQDEIRVVIADDEEGMRMILRKMIAKEEGFTEIAAKFKMVGDIEKAHEERYKKLLASVEKGEVFSREGVKVWKCLNCGHLHVGPTAPKMCPVCNHPQSYFEEQAVNY